MLPPRMTVSLLKSLKVVLDYNWHDELTDFRDREEGRESHIFRHLVALENWLYSEDRTPESYLPANEEPTQ